jgi:hypothetical protein
MIPVDPYRYVITQPYLVLLNIAFLYAVKPKEFLEEELDQTDPDSYYFVYILQKKRELVIKKNVKLGRLNAKALKALQPVRRRGPNAKPV